MVLSIADRILGHPELGGEDVQEIREMAENLKAGLSTLNYDTAKYIMTLEQKLNPDQFILPMDKETVPCDVCGGGWGGSPDCRDCASSPIMECLDDIEEEES